MSCPEIDAATVAWVTAAEMADVDRVMVDDLGITLVQMMENAGRGLAVLVRHLLGSAAGRRVCVLAGTGGNGGGGLAAARHLLVGGADVSVALSAHPRADTATATQLAILRRLGVSPEVGPRSSGHEADLTVDALLGYGQHGPPRGQVAALVRSTADPPIVALDVPSGLELATGSVHEPAVRATATLTLAAPKHGLEARPAHVGALYLADISVPPAVLHSVASASGPSAPAFSDAPLVRLR